MKDSIPKIFIGYDRNEKVAAYVLAHSIQRQASRPVSITFLNRQSLSEFTRPRGEFDSTDFSISRFLVPYLCDYNGFALFLDCDMVCLGDICELWACRDRTFMVQVVKHAPYTPKEEIKFLGNVQTGYSFKNWSSVMLFNNARCGGLTPAVLNKAEGLYLHQFNWSDYADWIGELPKEWNVLVGVQDIPEHPKLLHYTQGGPYFQQFKNCQCADLWFEEFRDMIYANTGNFHLLI